MRIFVRDFVLVIAIRSAIFSLAHAWGRIVFRRFWEKTNFIYISSLMRKLIVEILQFVLQMHEPPIAHLFRK